MKLSTEELKKLAEFAALLLSLKDNESLRMIIDAIPAFGAEFKPMISGAALFMTEVDIACVKKIMDAGFTAEQAIALRTSRKESTAAKVESLSKRCKCGG